MTIPAGYNGAQAAPLALILHGSDQTANEFAGLHPDLMSHANALGVLLVLPDSTSNARGTSWNSAGVSAENYVDDVGFLLALVDHLDTALNVDRKRVYAGGFSNGGQMCHRLASDTTNLLAAVAAVGSAIGGGRGGDVVITNPPPSAPISALILNATNDCGRPYWGGVNDSGELQAPAIASMAHYTNANSCVSNSVLSTNYFVAPNGSIFRFRACPTNNQPAMVLVTNLVIREHYQLTCSSNTEVLFITLTDGGHNWPDDNDHVGFDANREVLDFFLRHCNCNAVGATNTLIVPTTPGTYDLTLCDQGYSRFFRLQVPAGYNPANATPIVFTMHGGGQTVNSFTAEHPALFSKANLENILLVLPEALDHPVSRDTLWMNKPFDYVVDDRVFFTNLLEQLDAALNIDRRRVYACGFSGGGSFSHWLAATTPGVLAAIAPVCTMTGWNEPTAVDPAVPPPPPLEPIAVMMVRGTADNERPYNGGLSVDGQDCRSAADDVAYWTAGDTCVPPPITTAQPYGASFRYNNCAGTTEVILIRVDTMPHLWPDAADGYGYDANVEVVDFLLQFARP